MNLTLGQAAKEAGKSKATISKYLKNGKLSYLSKDDNGYQIDPAELFRVFPKGEHINSNSEQSQTPKKTHSNSTLEKEIDLLREQISRMDQMNERERAQLEKQIEDLRTDRDKWQGQANKLLLHYESDKKANQDKEQGGDSKLLLWLLPLLSALLVTLIGFGIYVFAPL